MEFPKSAESLANVPDETQDEQRTARFWERTQNPDVKETMMRNIETAVSMGSVGIFIQGDSEEDAEQMAAYRMLARDMGYTIGQFTPRPDGRTAIAGITGRRKR